MFLRKKKKNHKGSDMKTYLNQIRGNRRGVKQGLEGGSLAIVISHSANISVCVVVQQVRGGWEREKEV